MQIARTLLIAIVALAVAGCTGDPEPRLEQDAATCEFRPTGDRIGDIPAGIDAVSPDDVWVVGAHYEGGVSRPYASRWNGEGWSDTSVEELAAGVAGFEDVAAASRDEAWAVGSMRDTEPIAFVWDGSSWSSEPIPPLVENEEAALFGVASTGRSVWAVGRSRSGRHWSPLVMERRGGGWRRAPAPAPVGVDASLRGVDAAAPDDVWAVGWTAGAGGRLRTLAMHFDGGSWRRIPTPGTGGRYDVLAAVDVVGPQEAWAVGWTIADDGVDRPLIVRWDGERWSTVPPPELPGATHLISVSAPSSDSVWIVGRTKDETETFTSLVLRGDGEAWARVPTPDVGEEDDTLVGVTVVDGFPWAAGSWLGGDKKYRSLLLSGC